MYARPSVSSMFALAAGVIIGDDVCNCSITVVCAGSCSCSWCCHRLPCLWCSQLQLQLSSPFALAAAVTAGVVTVVVFTAAAVAVVVVRTGSWCRLPVTSTRGGGFKQELLSLPHVHVETWFCQQKKRKNNHGHICARCPCGPLLCPRHSPWGDRACRVGGCVWWWLRRDTTLMMWQLRLVSN